MHIPRYLSVIALSLCCLLGFVACDTDSNDSETDTDSRCLVTSAVLGGIPFTAHTISSQGTDSIYETNLTGSNYPLSIDQREGRIFLQDSLPYGSDISRITFSNFTFQGSRIVIRSLQTAGDTIFNASDSTDCRTQRLITVYASDGTSRSYTLQLMVHKQTGDEMNWQRVAQNEEVAKTADQRLVTKNNTLYLFGLQDGKSVMLISSDKGLTWQRHGLTVDLVPRSVVVANNTFYALLSDGKVIRSANGTDWVQVSSQTFNTLISSSNQLFGSTEKGIFSSADATAWTADALDASAALPSSEWCGVSIPSRTNAGYEDVVFTGLTTGGTPSVWHRTIDTNGTYTFPWNFIVRDTESNTYPTLQHTNLVVYDEAAVLFGVAADKKLAAPYFSSDRGRTWATTDIESPETEGIESLAVVADDDNYLWVTCGGTGEVWRGRLARLAWKTTQTKYYALPSKK